MDGQQQQLVVDLMPPQYAKPTTPPPSPPMNGMYMSYTSHRKDLIGLQSRGGNKAIMIYMDLPVPANRILSLRILVYGVELKHGSNVYILFVYRLL